MAIDGMVSPMLAIAEPYARLRLVWIRLRAAALLAARVSGSSTSSAIATPTTACGKPAASTPASIAGDSTLARPTTPTSAVTSSPRLRRAAWSLGGAACSSLPLSAPPSVSTGRKKSRCRTVCVSTNAPYSTSDAAAAKVSCGAENCGPGVVVVNVGSTRLSVARVATVASAAPVPSALKTARW